jgi:hypothetical protein
MFTTLDGKLGATSKAVQGFGKAMQFLSKTGTMVGIAGIAIAVKLIADRFQEAADNAAAYEKATKGVESAAKASLLSVHCLSATSLTCM